MSNSPHRPPYDYDDAVALVTGILRHHGWTVQRVPDPSTVVRIHKHGRTRHVDIAFKRNGPVFHRNSGQHRHGINLDRYNADEQLATDTGEEVWLFVWEVSDATVAYTNLMATDHVDVHQSPDHYDGDAMIYFDRTAFETLPAGFANGEIRVGQQRLRDYDSPVVDDLFGDAAADTDDCNGTDTGTGTDTPTLLDFTDG